jgi:phosphoglycerate kinase
MASAEYSAFRTLAPGGEEIMAKLSIRDLDLKGKRVFVRVDFNVPLDGERVTDDTRIRETLPTLRLAVEKGARLVLASHLGRPKGKVNPKYSLKPVADRLSELLGKPVGFAPDCVGPEAEALAKGLKDGDVLLLENLRFHPEEEANDPGFSRQLAALCDVYVNDAFGSAHRAHASTEGIAHFVSQAAAGLLMEKELNYLTRAISNPDHPYVAILGGAKVSDKIEVIDNLLKICDSLLIGGAMAYTFMQAQGRGVGGSKVEADKLDLARRVLSEVKQRNFKLLLPTDHVTAQKMEAGAEKRVVAAPEPIADGWMGLDIGPATVRAYAAEIAKAKTIVWNGPMGVFEIDDFAQGTMEIAKAVAQSGALSIVGGGDSVAALAKAGLTSKITHVSTGGGASLEFLSGQKLPGVEALSEVGRAGK